MRPLRRVGRLAFDEEDDVRVSGRISDETHTQDSRLPQHDECGFRRFPGQDRHLYSVVGTLEQEDGLRVGSLDVEPALWVRRPDRLPSPMTPAPHALARRGDARGIRRRRERADSCDAAPLRVDDAQASCGAWEEDQVTEIDRGALTTKVEYEVPLAV